MRDSNGSNGSNGNNPNTKAVRRCMILPFRVCVVTVAMIVCHHVPGVLSLSVSPSSSSSSQQPQKQQKEWVPQDEVLPQEYYAQVYDDDDERRIPWNVGGPQPAVVSAAKDGKFQRGQTVLDCGCGMGENSIFLAEKKGCVVTGFDLSEEAVNKARQRSSVARFEVASCLDLSSSALAGQTFDVALDAFTAFQMKMLSGMFGIWHRLLPTGSLWVASQRPTHLRTGRTPEGFPERTCTGISAPRMVGRLLAVSKTSGGPVRITGVPIRDRSVRLYGWRQRGYDITNK